MRKLYGLLTSLILFCCLSATAQTKDVTGKVTDANDGAALPGVTVKVKNGKASTTSGADGTFRLTVPESATTLVFTYVGYNEVELAISELMNVTMTAGNSALSEVVVVGYGTKTRRDLTGNIAKVSGDEVKDVPVPNFTQALQGRAAGVFIESQNGKVGGGVKVRIRGAGSISASNEPLYVVDGIPINTGNLSGSALADFNFNDVESFEILKDASAAAIYGSRAANGVVLITTRKGKAGRSRLNVGLQYGASKPTGYRGFLNAEEYIAFFREAARNGAIYHFNREGNYYGYADEQEAIDDWVGFVEGRFTRYSGHSDWETLETNTDWEKQAFQDANTLGADFTLSGGSERTRFYFSGGYMEQDGILVGNTFQRVSGRLNLDHDVSDRLKVGVNLSLSRTKGRRVAADNLFNTPMQIVALAPITPVRDTTGKLYDRPVTTYYNPLIDFEDGTYLSTTYRNVANVFGQLNIVKGLIFRTEYGIDLLTQDDDEFYGSRTINGQSTNGFGRSTWFRTINLNTNNYFNYSNIFADIHDVDVTLGMSLQKAKTDISQLTGEDFPVDALRKLASAGKITGGTSSQTNYSFLSYFARANYKLYDKYLLTVSGRIDGSSRFGKESRYGFFPAVSAGWIISNEDFLKNSGVLSFLKLRSSYGFTGNAEGIGDFPQLGLWGASKYNLASALVPTQLPNPDLKWEKSQQVDIGIDFGFFNNRLSGEVDYYVKKTSDLLYNLPVPGTSGFSTIFMNIGSMENKGFEVVLNSTNISARDFTWTTSLNFSKNDNKITKLDGISDTLPGNDGRYLNSLIVGQPIGVFYGPMYAGVDPDNGDALFYEQDGKTTTNDYNAAGNFVVGNPNPDYIYGLSNTFSYKGIELNVLIQGVHGNQIMNGAGGFMSANGDWLDNQTKDQLNRWQTPGQVTNVPQARLNLSSIQNGISASSRYIEDGSYLRLKTVSLGYNLPSSLLSRFKINSLRVYLLGQNLATITNYSGWDPEVNTDYRAGNRNQGGDFYAAPQIKTFTFGINVGL